MFDVIVSDQVFKEIQVNTALFLTDRKGEGCVSLLWSLHSVVWRPSMKCSSTEVVSCYLDQYY